MLDKFIDQFLLQPTQDPVENDPSNDEDFVLNYSILILKYFFLLLDFKDAVREGNGARLATLHKVLVQHFKSFPGFNAYAIEMLISVVQNEVFLTEARHMNVCGLLQLIGQVALEETLRLTSSRRIATKT